MCPSSRRSAPHYAGGSSRTTRADIQALRGFAVLLVVVYHAKLPWLAAGLLGVDIFFVISGFLITGMIVREADAGTFAFRTFYLRRARRLLPAALVTFTATAVLGPFVLARPELMQLRAQIIGAVTFTGNIVLWRQSGYFDTEAALKPLLHVWSLAIEEQFYFVMPALLMWTPARHRRLLLAAIVAASLALCLWRVGLASTFYLAPTRAWELGLGAIGALVTISSTRTQRWLAHAVWPASVVIIVVPGIKTTLPHPGLLTLTVCLATLVILIARRPGLATGRAWRPIIWLGDRSYALYLVHWPVFAFFNATWQGPPASPLTQRWSLVLLGVSLVLAALLHRLVEAPLHHAPPSANHRIVTGSAVVSAALIVFAVMLPHGPEPGAPALSPRRANYGLSPACEYDDTFTPKPECQTGPRPAVLLWGDSFAMHLAPGLRETAPTLQFAQATRSQCGPLLGIASFPPLTTKQAFAETCLRFNDSVIEYLRQTPSITTVVVASPFASYVIPEERLMRRTPAGGLVAVTPSLDEAVAGVIRTADAVRALGRRIVVVAPPPTNGANVARCAERIAKGLPVFGIADDCAIRIPPGETVYGGLQSFFERLQRAGIPVIDFSVALCDAGTCRTTDSGQSIYRDAGHLSYAGSVIAARATRLASRVMTEAR